MEEIRDLLNEIRKEIRLPIENGFGKGLQELLKCNKDMDNDYNNMDYNNMDEYGVGLEDTREQEEQDQEEQEVQKVKILGLGNENNFDNKNDLIETENVCFFDFIDLDIQMEQEKLGGKNIEVFDKDLINDDINAQVLYDDIKISTTINRERVEQRYWIWLILKRKEIIERRFVKNRYVKRRRGRKEKKKKKKGRIKKWHKKRRKKEIKRRQEKEDFEKG